MKALETLWQIAFTLLFVILLFLGTACIIGVFAALVVRGFQWCMAL